MCGIIAAIGPGAHTRDLQPGLDSLNHRGPDGHGTWVAPDVALGHTRLAIVDLDPRANQPMMSRNERFVMCFNGEIYNYRELARSLTGPWRTTSDSEVVVEGFASEGEAFFDRCEGMFACVIHDRENQSTFVIRDRFGVKPLFWARSAQQIVLASEIPALHAVGVPRSPNLSTWAHFLQFGDGAFDGSSFWDGIQSIPPGHCGWITGSDLTLRQWFAAEQLVSNAPSPDLDAEFAHELERSVNWRFRSDVPVGVSLSGGFDSSILAAAIARTQDAGQVTAYTFACNDPNYDETEWAARIATRAGLDHVVVELNSDDVPALASSLFERAGEPCGGIPTLAYAALFAAAKQDGVSVLLDGQGLDESWAGYDYYRNLSSAPQVQGSHQSPVRPEAVRAEWRIQPEPIADAPRDALTARQLRDITTIKLPRALRYNDRASMRSSVELREPFLDHRLVALGLSAPAEEKIAATTGKVLPRRVLRSWIGEDLALAPKRPVQTPQREWLAGPLSAWVRDTVKDATTHFAPDFLDEAVVEKELNAFMAGRYDNSYFVWQWVTLGLMAQGQQ